MRISRDNQRSSRQSGYTLLMVLFLVASMLIVMAAATPDLLTQGRRERETETIWRGEQYARAIGMYYRKFGRYPTKIDDLVKQTNGVRFLRQAYKDPTNKVDGTWRFIYVGPNGQLIGSVRNVSLLQGALTNAATSNNAGSVFGGGAQQLAPPGAFAAASPSGPGGQQAPGGAQSGGTSDTSGGTQGPGGAQQGPGGQQPGGQQTSSAFGIGSSDSQPQPLEGDVLGGNIIGVGCKTMEPSLRVYKNGDNYHEWEFIWNPLQQAGIPTQQPVASPGVTPPPGSFMQSPGSNQANPQSSPSVPFQ